MQRAVTGAGADLGIAFDGDGDRMLAVDARGQVVDGDQILAILMMHLEVELVAVTVMANLGLHRLAEEHGIRVVTTDVGDRYVLEALRREGGLLGGEQSGHIIYLRDHVTGDGLAAALLLCAALEGHSLERAAAVLRRLPQAKENIRVGRKDLPQPLLDEVERLNTRLDGKGRVLVRPSGTEPRDSRARGSGNSVGSRRSLWYHLRSRETRARLTWPDEGPGGAAGPFAS